MKKRILILALFFLTAQAVFPQGTFGMFTHENHPELNWYSYDTDNFRIVYSTGLEETAKKAGLSAEKAYASHMANLDLTFKRRYTIFISDMDNISNGATSPTGYFFVWVSPTRYNDYFSGNDRWLDKVISHEMVHALIFENTSSWINIFFPSLLSVPRDVHEGYAQFFAGEQWGVKRGDQWLSESVWEGDTLTGNGGALTYAKGFSQIRYLYSEYSDKKAFGRLFKYRDKAGLFNINKAFEETFGEKRRDFQKRWKRDMEIYYNWMAGISEKPEEIGDMLYKEHYFHQIKQFLPYKKGYLVMGVEKSRYPGLKLYYSDDGLNDAELIAESGIIGRASLDGDMLLYARSRKGKHGSIVSDIYSYGNSESRLTDDENGYDPAGSGGSIYYLKNDGGVSVLKQIGADRPLYAASDGMQLYDLTIDRSGENLAAAYIDTVASEQGIWLFSITEKTVIRFPTAYKAVSPSFSPDGSALAYAVYGIYASPAYVLNIKDMEAVPVTGQYGVIESLEWTKDGLLAVISIGGEKQSLCLIDPARTPLKSEEKVRDLYSRWTHTAPLHTPGSADISMEGKFTGPYKGVEDFHHIMTLPRPFFIDGHIAPGLMTVWADKIGWHYLAASGGIELSDGYDTNYSFLYKNSRTASDIAFSFSKSDRQIDKYHGNELNMRNTLVLAGVTRRFSAPNTFFLGHTISAGGGYRHMEPLASEGYEPDEAKLTDVFAYFSYKLVYERPWTCIPDNTFALGVKAAFSKETDDNGNTAAFIRADLIKDIDLGALVLRGQGAYLEQFGTAKEYDRPYVTDYMIVNMLSAETYDYSKSIMLRGIDRTEFGNRIFRATLELRYPLSDNASGILFNDNAFVTDDMNNGRKSHPGTYGIQYSVSLGSLMASAGVAKDLYLSDSKEVYFFSLNSALGF